MSSLTIDVDTSGMLAAFDQLGELAETLLDACARDAAEQIAREATQRVARSSGTTQRGIHVEASRNPRRKGWLAMAYDTEIPTERGPVDLWLEFGTKRGAPGSHASPARPFFFNAIRLEETRFRANLADALDRAIEQLGFADGR